LHASKQRDSCSNAAFGVFCDAIFFSSWEKNMTRWQGWIMAGVLGLFSCSAVRAATSYADRFAAPVPTSYRTVFGIGHLGASDLTEASGLAASRRTDGLLWAVNDSGNAPELYALGSRGEDRGSVGVLGVKNTDWEDLAAFTWQGKAYLLVADVGDNRAVRPQVQLHVVPEPLPGDDGRFSGTITPAWSISLQFEDGPRDCEGVAVDEQQGQVLLLSKRTSPPVLYRLPLRPARSDQMQIARRVVEIKNIPSPDRNDLAHVFGRYRSWPTAFDIRADGRAAVILTYKNAYLYLRQGGESWRKALTRRPQIIALPDDERLPQREAICFDGEDGLLVTSEGQKAALFRLPSKQEPAEP
jgi:hypothetical protein